MHFFADVDIIDRFKHSRVGFTVVVITILLIFSVLYVPGQYKSFLYLTQWKKEIYIYIYIYIYLAPYFALLKKKKKGK